MDSRSYLNIQGWMVTDLGLGGTDLIIYAIVYGFSQDGQGECWSSLDYFTAWCGCDRRTIQRSMDRLVESGLIIKRARAGTTSALRAVNPRQNINKNEKTNNQPTTKCHGGGDKMSQVPTTKCHGGGDKMSHNNKYIINNDNKNIIKGGGLATEEPSATIAPISGIDNRGTVSSDFINQCRSKLQNKIKSNKDKREQIDGQNATWNI